MEYLLDYQQFASEFDFSVEYDDSRGKHLVSKKEIPPNVVILEENPLVAWPLHTSLLALGSRQFCEQCLMVIHEKASKEVCSTCSACFCSEECFQRSQATHPCLCGNILWQVRSWQLQRNVESPITAESLLRCLATVTSDYEFYVKTYQLSHEDAYLNAFRAFFRLTQPPAAATFDDREFDVTSATKSLQAILRPVLEVRVGQQLSDHLLSQEMIQCLLGKLTLNAQAFSTTSSTEFSTPISDQAEFSVSSQFSSKHSVLPPKYLNSTPHPATSTHEFHFQGAGVYMFQSCMNHSCDPNCVVKSSKGSTIQIQTLRTIAAKEELTIAYIPVEYDLEKRKSLLSHYYFNCGCCKCKKPQVVAGTGAFANNSLPTSSLATTPTKKKP